ncbi:hypothetical protein [Streptomyces roseolilacinus]|uniref:hypothetical protein n=1 Tax=Streptomyces roseolilacinus TaxID=66904 RepID=UPI003823E148
MRNNDHVFVRIDLEFRSGQHEMAMGLFDHEDLGPDDNLGTAYIRDNSTPVGVRKRVTLENEGAIYELTYAIGERTEF